MNVRSATLIAGAPERRQLAGDQFFVDLDLSVQNIPPGAQQVGRELNLRGVNARVVEGGLVRRGDAIAKA